MKTIRLIIVGCLIASANLLASQNLSLPDTDLFTLDGDRINASDITGDNVLTIVLFWNMNDPKSVEQLLSFNEVNDDLTKGKNVKMIGICTDVTGYMQGIKPFINGTAVGIDIYIDKNNDLKRMMSIPDTPYALLFDKEKNKQATVMGSCVNINSLIDVVMSDHLASGK